VGFVPDLGDDHACRNCGYNLRGLQVDARCPECGAVFGIDPFVDPLPWDQKQTLGTFLSTFLMVLFTPKDLAAQIWHGYTIDGTAAIRFRRICVGVATLSLLSVMIVLIGRASSWIGAACISPVIFMSALLWATSFTNESIDFFKDKGAGSPQRRAKALARYAAAGLLLTPAHWVLLKFTYAAAGYDGAVLALAAGCHALLLLVQLLTCACAEAALLWQLVDVSRGTSFAIALGNLSPRLFYTGIYLLVIPWLLAVVASAIGGG
jgi:hypothetical protein